MNCSTTCKAGGLGPRHHFIIFTLNSLSLPPVLCINIYLWYIPSFIFLGNSLYDFGVTWLVLLRPRVRVALSFLIIVSPCFLLLAFPHIYNLERAHIVVDPSVYKSQFSDLETDVQCSRFQLCSLLLSGVSRPRTPFLPLTSLLQQGATLIRATVPQCVFLVLLWVGTLFFSLSRSIFSSNSQRTPLALPWYFDMSRSIQMSSRTTAAEQLSNFFYRCISWLLRRYLPLRNAYWMVQLHMESVRCFEVKRWCETTALKRRRAPTSCFIHNELNIIFCTFIRPITVR